MPTFEYVLPVIRGIQAGREYYVSMCPLGILPKLFPLSGEEVHPERRSQRRVNSSRVKQLSQYVFKNRTDYILSAITASIDADVVFEPLGEKGEERKMGRLRIPMDGELTIQDGLHRRVALEKVLKENPELSYEAIAVIFFLDIGLDRCQQMFKDLNSYGMRSSLSLAVLYDHRDKMAVVTRKVLERVGKLRELTEVERDSLGKNSLKLFTLYQVYQETVRVLGNDGDKGLDEQVELGVKYWQEKLFING
ncbi:DGQHR domain protein [Gloeothece citriformis PCC 7424]|uniref:DGQHR domain protein n=1 Tax=Gloeothece citriformis (strain PCC 7424) TaxID=65393 RepID=B7KD73_GLOC7|nr:DNA sulfur modification protein DndB [Gloeothece citriformis]ACK73194.1 DGQHR domain protein [Gloeothece citriformis PCC 7424]